MNATFEFAVNGLNMEFAFRLMTDGHNIPRGLSVDILTEKCQLIHKHICKAKDCLMMVANVTNTVATIKFFDWELEDSQLIMVTISNLPDHAAELHSIDTYYSELEYDEMVQADLL